MDLKEKGHIKNIQQRLKMELEKDQESRPEGFLADDSLIPLLRAQLLEEKDPAIQFELCFALWKMMH